MAVGDGFLGQIGVDGGGADADHRQLAGDDEHLRKGYAFAQRKLQPLFEDQNGRPVYGQLVQQGELIAVNPGSNRRFAGYDQVLRSRAERHTSSLKSTSTVRTSSRPIHISSVIGMPTICQCVCSPIMNIGRCANTPASTSRWST